MFLTIDEDTLLLGVGTPEKKNKVFALVRKSFYNRVGEAFPAFILMRSGLIGADSEGGV